VLLMLKNVKFLLNINKKYYKKKVFFTFTIEKV
jgi:hypothetical protein